MSVLSPLPVMPPTLCLGALLACLLLGDRWWLLRTVAFLAQAGLLLTGSAILYQAQTGSLFVHRLGGWKAPLGIVFVADRITSILLVLVQLVFAAALVYFSLDRERRQRRSRVLALLFLLQAGVSGCLLTGDLFDFYVFFELMGLSSYALVGYRRTEVHVEAALKFACLSLLGSTLMLMGIGAVYAQTGTLSFAGLRTASETIASPPLYLFATGLVLVALCLKCAVAPLHFWLPDAHSIAPTAISVVLSGAMVKLGAYGIVRLLGSNAPWVWEAVGKVLLPAGAGTALFAAVVAVGQRDLKRLLAWSTASQMGYVVSAVALGTVAGVAAAVTYAVAHALMKSALFVSAGVAIEALGEQRWDRMGGMLQRSPLYAAALLVSLLSLAGIPPLAGFSGKVAIFTALIERGAWTSLGCLVGASALMIYLAARLWMGICGGTPDGVRRRPPSAGKVTLSAALAGLVLLAGIGTGPILGSARAAAEELFAGSSYRAAVLGTDGREVAR